MRPIVATLLIALTALTLSAFAAEAPPHTPTPAPAPSQPPTQTDPQDPAARDFATLTRGLLPGSRILKTFDFEEKKLGNHEDTPMFWDKVAGRGFPLYSTGKFDTTSARSEKTSFRLTLDGGSAAYRLQPGRFPVVPSADHFVIGFVKTSALAHARAQITAWLADKDGNRLEGTQVHTRPYASPTGKDDWTLLHMFIPGNNPKAASLVLEMALLQPQQRAAQALGPFDLYQQDIKGSAWFDDLVVFQLPRLAVHVNAVAGIVPPRHKAELSLTVSDLGRDHLTAHLLVQDAAGREAHRQQWSFHTDPKTLWTQNIALGPLPAGLYTATLNVHDRKGVVARRQARFASLETTVERPQVAPEFGIDATAWPVEAWGELPTALLHANAGLVKLPAWRRDMSEDALIRRDQPFDNLINALQRHEIRTVASFSEIPSALTVRLNEKSDSILALLDVDPNIWKPYVSFILARYANRVDLWQLGRAGDAFHANDSRYPRLYTKTRGELAALLPDSPLVIPWNALYDFDAAQYPRAILDLRLPPAIRPAHIPAYIDSFAQQKVGVLAAIEPLDEFKYPRDARLNDFAQRLVYARTANPRAVLMTLPLSRRATLTESVTEPEELLLVFRTIAQTLSNATYQGELLLHPGVKAFLFDRRGTGTLVLWNEKASDPETTLAIALGKSPVQVERFGRTSPVPTDKGIAKLRVTTAPLIITNIDARMAKLRGSFSLGAPTVPAGVGAFQTTVHLVNPYDAPMNGSLHVRGPSGWTVDPPVIPVTIKPGEMLSAPVTLRYPFTAFAGPKVITGRLTLEEDLPRSMELLAHTTLTSDEVDMECFAIFAPNGDLVLQQMISNTSNAPLNTQAYALVPGMARQQRFVLDLQPGHTVVKRFTFPGAAALSGKAAAMGLRQPDGKTLLTKAVPLD